MIVLKNVFLFEIVTLYFVKFRICGIRSTAARSIAPRGKKILFFFRENGANGCRVPVGSRGVPKPLVDWRGMRVFSRWWSIYSKKARYWPQRGSYVVLCEGRRVFAATVHVHVTCAHVVYLPTHAWRQIFAHRSHVLGTHVSYPCGVVGRIIHAPMTRQFYQ